MNKRDNNFIERELSQFKRKYWLAKLFQGVLIFAGTGLVLFFLIALVEYFSWLSVIQRTVIFWSVSAVEFILLSFYIFWPLYQIIINGRGLADAKAAQLIGSEIAGVKDRLTNYLELKSFSNNSDLIDAGINQKQSILSSFSFTDAVKFSSLKPFLLFLIPVALLLVFVWSGDRWFMLTEGANRLVNFSTVYQKQLPFTIQFNQDLMVDEGHDFELNVVINGDVIPEELMVQSMSSQRVISRKNQNEYGIVFQNCLHDIPFSLGYDDVFSEEYVLKVRKRAAVGRVTFNVTPPAYTKISSYIIENSSLLEVPQFSLVEVLYAFKNTEALLARLERGTDLDTFSIQKNQSIEFRANQNATLQAFASNEVLSSAAIKVLVDKRPELDVKVDSLASGIVIYISANDDYGITKAGAVFIQLDKTEKNITLPSQGALLKASIKLSLEEIKVLSKLKIQVFDYNGVSSKTIDLEKYIVKEKDEKQLLDNAGSNINELAKEEKNSKANPSKKQENQKKKAEEINKAAKELTKKDSVLFQRFEELSEEILKLTEQLDKKLPESRKKITEKKLEEKIAELEKEWMILQTIEQLKEIEDSLAKSDNAIDEKKMEELQKSAEELQKTMSDDPKKEDVEWEKFKEIEKNNEALDSANAKENEAPKDSKEKSKDSKKDDLKDEMKKDSESLREQLAKMSDIMMSESAAQNVELIRRLELRALKNSKKQEEVYESSVNATQIDKAEQVAQKEVNQSARNILDSLSALTVSDPLMAQVLMEYQEKLDLNLEQMSNVEADDVRNYVSNQRYLQYGLNDLAAILYDILKAESQNLMDMKEGNKSCNNPKPGKGKKPSLSGQQKKLGEKMGEQSRKPGKGKGGKQPMSQAEMLELIKGQEAIIEQYEQKGGSKSGEGELAQELNKQLEDLINMNLDKALERNKSIEDKLLVLEESENQKEEQKEERQSKENLLDYEAIKQSSVQDYLKTKQRETSVVNLPALKNYFTGKWVKINQE